MMKVGHAPDPDAIPTLESLGVELHADTLRYVEDPEALANALGGNSGPPPLQLTLTQGVINVFRNPVVFLAALCACVGGLMFGLYVSAHLGTKKGKLTLATRASCP